MPLVLGPVGALAGRFIAGHGGMLIDFGTWAQEHTAVWEASSADPDLAANPADFEAIIAETDRRLGP